MKRRRHVLRKPLLLFALLLLGPALGFSLLGWESVVQEHEFRLRDMERTAKDVVEQRIAGAAESLDRIRTVERNRAYYEYQSEFMPAEVAYGDVTFQKSSLARSAPRGAVIGQQLLEIRCQLS